MFFPHPSKKMHKSLKNKGSSIRGPQLPCSVSAHTCVIVPGVFVMPNTLLTGLQWAAPDAPMFHPDKTGSSFKKTNKNKMKARSFMHSIHHRKNTTQVHSIPLPVSDSVWWPQCRFARKRHHQVFTKLLNWVMSLVSQLTHTHTLVGSSCKHTPAPALSDGAYSSLGKRLNYAKVKEAINTTPIQWESLGAASAVNHGRARYSPAASSPAHLVEKWPRWPGVARKIWRGQKNKYINNTVKCVCYWVNTSFPWIDTNTHICSAA